MHTTCIVIKLLLFTWHTDDSGSNINRVCQNQLFDSSEFFRTYFPQTQTQRVKIVRPIRHIYYFKNNKN